MNRFWMVSAAERELYAWGRGGSDCIWTMLIGLIGGALSKNNNVANSGSAHYVKEL